MPEVELRNPAKNKNVWGLGNAGLEEPDYASIEVPTLPIYAAPRSIGDLEPWMVSDEPKRLELLERLFRHQTAQRKRDIETFRQQAKNSRVVVIKGAAHYLFLTHETEVLREVQVFFMALDSDSD